MSLVNLSSKPEHVVGSLHEVGARPAMGLAVVLAAVAAAGIAQPAWMLAASSSWNSALTLLLAAPVLEEMVFRGGLMESLLRTGARAWVANLIATAAFVLAHALVRGAALALAVALPSLLLGVLYARQRRVAPCIGLHAFFNLAWLVSAPLAPAGVLTLLRLG
jgi:membrane protease YdiL (CAAX protease family)